MHKIVLANVVVPLYLLNKQMCRKSILSINLDTAEEKVSELDIQIKAHRQNGLQIVEKKSKVTKGHNKKVMCECNWSPRRHRYQ